MKYNFPKVELHCHIDGAFRPQTIWELAKEQNVQLPADTQAGYEAFIEKASRWESVNEALKMFDGPLLVMQDPDSLARVTREVIEDLAAQGVALAELRFAPQLHRQKGMTMSDAIEAVLRGKDEALAEGIDMKVGILTCMMVSGPEKVTHDANAETVEVCKKYLGKGVVGLDLAGQEGFDPLSAYAPLFARARELGIPCTCHAGDSQGPETVRDAMNNGVQRIGHGHHIYFDPALCREAIQKNIAFEICPTSNILCKTEPSFAEHPAWNMYAMGMKVTINTDDPTLCGDTIETEYDHCINEMGFTEKDLIQCNLNSLDASFLPEEEKADIRKKLEAYEKD